MESMAASVTGTGTPAMAKVPAMDMTSVGRMSPSFLSVTFYAIIPSISRSFQLRQPDSASSGAHQGTDTPKTAYVAFWNVAPGYPGRHRAAWCREAISGVFPPPGIPLGLFGQNDGSFGSLRAILAKSGIS